ncbi:MAG: hypothetical protein Q8S44_10325 [Flavobacteriaceae bacterium]|nr:hypothetical protein [Flavobacteriaceae bacterium]
MEYNKLLTELKTPSIIYEIYKEWLSELDFIDDEIIIFEELINIHFIELCNFQLYNESKELIQQFKLNKLKLDHLKSEIYTHQKYLATLIESNNLNGEEVYYTKHRVISEKKLLYLQNVKEIKSSTYNLIKEILKRNKQKKIDK